MRGGIVEGLANSKTPVPLAVTPEGVLLADDVPDSDVQKLMLLELRAVRIGLEILNRQKVGTLIELAKEEDDYNGT